jgi:hypothetical protein
MGNRKMVVKAALKKATAQQGPFIEIKAELLPDY